MLIFVPGIGEISYYDKIVDNFCQQNNIPASRYLLHSQITNNHQSEVFKPSPPGIRKIVIATSIAETSITIPDVSIVIDTGFIKEAFYDDEVRATNLRREWISQANAN